MTPRGPVFASTRPPSGGNPRGACRLRIGVGLLAAAALLLGAALPGCATRRVALLPAPPAEVRKAPAVAAKAADRSAVPFPGPIPERPPAPWVLGPYAAGTPAPPPAAAAPSPPKPPPPDTAVLYANAIARTKEAIARNAPRDAVPLWAALEETRWGADAVYNQGVLLQMAGDPDNAARTYGRLVRKDPPYGPAAANLLGLHLLRGRLEDAVPLAERVLGQAPPGEPLPEAEANAAAAMIEAGRIDRAEEVLRGIRGRGAATPALAWNLAIVAYRKGDIPAARSLSAGLPPAVADLWPVAASRRAWDRDGPPLPALDNATSREPRLAALERNIAAYAAFRNGNLGLAERTLAGAPEGSPYRGEMSTNLGIVLAEQGKWKEARDFLEKAVRERPGLPEGWLNLGIFRQIFGGDAAGARECFENYVKLYGPRKEEVRKWIERPSSPPSPPPSSP